MNDNNLLLCSIVAPLLLVYVHNLQWNKTLFDLIFLTMFSLSLFNPTRLSLEHLLSFATDVARALNYVHNMTPDPIIHRDFSSANVLLQPTPDGGWLAKVSDYGTANFQSQLQTENPGSPVYTAPESRDPALQSPKMDIYNFGVLLVEMYTCDFPAPERREELMESIDYPRLLNLINV